MLADETTAAAGCERERNWTQGGPGSGHGYDGTRGQGDPLGNISDSQLTCAWQLHPHLTSLDISVNCLQNEGAKYLAECLSGFPPGFQDPNSLPESSLW